MQTTIDPKLFAAVLTASATVIIASFTYIANLISEILERKRKTKAGLMQIRNELLVNQGIAKAIIANTRTYGILFQDNIWKTYDTSVIYGGNVPVEQILEVYTKIQLYNTLNERFTLIKDKDNYGPNKEYRLAQRGRKRVRP